MPEQLDVQRVQAFARELFRIYTGGILTVMIQLGHRTGLFEAAAKGPATSSGLARRAGLDERYVREWLGAMTTGRIMTHDPSSDTYELPSEHAICLTRGSRLNVAPYSGAVTHVTTHLQAISKAFRNGGGVPYSKFQPELTGLLDEATRRIYDETLISGFLPSAPGLTERLRAGAQSLDVGCGTGHAVNLMARAFPLSTFVGYDLGEAAIAEARDEAARMGLSNVRFEVLDVARLPAEPKFDVIFAFDSIHDQVAPATVLARISDALAAGGLFFMMDIKGSSSVDGDMENFFAPFYYGMSVMHCMTVSLAHGGAGLGAMWGEKVARRMLAEAGFNKVDVVDCPRPQCCVYLCRR
jgi:SAM-dependent methyltransferase